MNVQQLLHEAVNLHRNGRLAEAERVYSQILTLQPGMSAAQHMLGLLRLQQGRGPEALALIGAALNAQPGAPDIWSNYGLVLKSLGRFEEALAGFDRAVALKPDYPEAWNNRGGVLGDLQRFGEALASFDRVLALQPASPDVLFNRGTCLRHLKRLDEALASYERALAVRPDFIAAMHGAGVVLRELHRFDAALAIYERAVAAEPRVAESWYNRGIVLVDLKRAEEAVASFDRALTLRADYADAWNNRGGALRDAKRFEEALASFDRALAVQPSQPEAWNNRATVLQELHRATEAVASCERALALKPDFARALNNRGNAFHILKRYDEALASFDHALAIDAGDAEVWNNRGSALWDMARIDEARASYDRAIAIRPDFAAALHNRGNMQWARNRLYHEAIRDLEATVTIDPDYEFALGDLLHLKMYGADWSGFERQASLIDAGVRAGKRVVEPFVYQALSGSPADLQACSKIYAGRRFPAAPALWREGPRRHDKIRVGYVCGEFRAQATSFLSVGLYERHDRGRFEIVGFDNGWSDNSAIRKRLESGFDKFIDIAPLSDGESAARIHAEEIDILVNLNGYYGALSMDVFARRPAPLQVNYLGFPATLGADYIDYILADRIVIPPGEERFYTEKIVYLPDTYQVNDSGRRIAEAIPARAACGLPDSAFVFCWFNHSYKLTPAMFAVWMRILKRVEGSVLWLLETHPAFAENLRREAERHGVTGTRLVFAPPIVLEDHLARLALGDLFLDSIPYNAHTTASDALWAGLPLLTCRGTAFAGRVAASLLHAVGLPELVTENLEQYESLALALAGDAPRLKALRQKLAHNRKNTALFDTDRFRRNIEAAYAAMWEMRQRGEIPRAFSVDPS